MSRLVAYRAKASEGVRRRIDETLAATMYLVQTTGPTSFVVQEQHCDKKHKVLVGPLQTCSCGDADVCIHLLFVMLKVLRVPATNPIVWQKSLIDSEVDALLRGDHREKPRTPPPKSITRFLKKHRKDGAEAEPQTDAEESDAHERHELVPGEVCAICQEDMVADQPLTFCRKGCGNNFHIECMKVFGESRKQSKEHLICPLCRHDWGDLALTELKKEMDIANKAPNVHKNVGCRKCQAKPIRNERYRCVQCKNVDLCDRCFKMNAHINHSFVMKKLVTDAWTPALRSSQARSNNIPSDLVEELQNRDLTTNDYDILLQLDQRDKMPVQDFLLSILGGQRVSAANAKSFGEPGAMCSICRQSLRIQADVRSIICGHAFHESCLARSILSNVYACPHPNCDHILFPGLHHLVVKNKSAGEEDGHIHQTASLKSNGVDMSLSVMPLQQQASSSIKCKPTHIHKMARPPARPSSQSSITASDLAALSIGLPPIASSNIQRGLPQVKDKSRVLLSSDTRKNENRSRGSQSETLGGLEDNSSFSVGQAQPSSEDRLRHADDLRSEMKRLDQERLRKQRVQREQRVRQNLSNNQSNHAAVNDLLPPVGKFPTLPGIFIATQEQRASTSSKPRGQETRNKHRSRADTHSASDATTESILPELSIGAIRRL